MPARKPTRLLELSGAYRHNPQRRRPPEPQPTAPLGPAPEHLSPEAAACWAELEAMIPPGVVFASDRWAMELSATSMADTRSGTISNARYAGLLRLMAALGLSPVDRSRLSVPPEKPQGKFGRMAADGMN